MPDMVYAQKDYNFATKDVKTKNPGRRKHLQAGGFISLPEGVAQNESSFCACL